MRILFISPRQCWPPITGARLREYYLAKALGRHAALTHVFFAQPGGPVPGTDELPFSRTVLPVPQPRLYTAGKILRGIWSTWPLPAINYYSEQMCAALEAVLDREDFDLIHLDSLHMGVYIHLLERRTRAPVVFDWHNIESEALRRYGASIAARPQKAYAALTARKLEHFEDWALRKGLGHAVCSEREREKLLLRRPGARIAVIENGVDTELLGEAIGGAGPRRRLVFVGSMNYGPNVDAATYFAHNLWPSLREQFPDWTLTIVGSNPTPAVTALRDEPAVEVTGAVDDVRPYYAEAVAAIVPLRSGGGTRLKILEAMAAGTPVVSTQLGAEGLMVSPGRHILIAETLEQWRSQLAALAPRGELWRRISRSARELAESRYDWAGIGESLYQAYCCWLEAAKRGAAPA